MTCPTLDATTCQGTGPQAVLFQMSKVKCDGCSRERSEFKEANHTGNPRACITCSMSLDDRARGAAVPNPNLQLQQ